MSAGEVQVHLFAAARAAVGASVVTKPSGSLGEILDSVESAHPDFGAVRPRCSYLVNEVSTRDLSTVVSAGGRIDVLPPFAGG